jgi:CHAT domain-containing protein
MEGQRGRIDFPLRRIFMTLAARVRLLIILAHITVAAATGVSAADDPVARFVAAADSLLKTGDAKALASLVSRDSILCGAAVGQLLDAAVKEGDGGNGTAEKDKLSLAEGIARRYFEATGSRAPLDLVTIYRNWKPGQRTLRAKAKALEEESTQARKEGELDRAVQLLDKAQALYRTIDDRRSRAVVWGSLGVTHWYRSDWEAVGRSYRNALSARRAIDDRILEGRTLNGLGSLAFQTGDYVGAIDFYGQAVRLRRRTGDLGGLGTSLTYMGNAYMRLGRLAEARDRFNEALEIVEADGSPQQRAGVLNSIASVDADMGRLREACEIYARAIDVARDAGDVRQETNCRLNLGETLRLMGSYRQALGELEKAADLLAASSDVRQEAELCRNRGFASMDMGELDRSRDDFIAFLSKSKELGDVIYEIEAFIALGHLYHALGALEQGLACADSAGAIAERSGRLRELREALVLAADIDQSAGNPERALEHLAGALQRDTLDGFELYALHDRARMANALSALGRREEARDAFRKIAAEAGNLAENVRWVSEFGIADTYERENPDSAYAHYEKAFGLLERSRAAIGGAETETGFFSGDRRRLFEEVARYYASLEASTHGGVWSTRAFDAIERGKARGLLDLLERSLGAQSSPAEEALLDSLYRLDRGSPGYAESERKLRGRYVEMRSARLGESVRKLGVGRGVAGMADIERSLPKGTALLEYALGDTVSLLWAIDRSGSALYELPGRAALRDGVGRLRDAIMRPGAGDAQLLAEARKLYVALIGPAENTVSRAHTLVIVPDGELFALPYDLLLTTEPKPGAAWKRQPFLAKSCATVYAPSASIFLKLGEGAADRRHAVELAAFGDPDFSRLAGAEPGLEPLPNSRSEVQSIAARFPADREVVFVGPDASEAAFKAVLPERTPRVLHLATHGIADPAEPVNSRIILSPSESPREDGRLYTLEIMSTPVTAELVVLSACESGMGAIGRGEGVVGLSRAFIAAGARGVVVSLWPVSDASTARLMEKMYADMIGRRRPAFDALRRARLALLDDPTYGHPFYWSPFIMIGTERAPW